MACLYAFVGLVVYQEELGREKRQREQVEQEKDVTIADLQHKLDIMETDYEKILLVSCNADQFKLKLNKQIKERSAEAATDRPL